MTEATRRSHALLRDRILQCCATGALGAADAERRRWRALLGGIYCLEGTISAGKTTLGRDMARLLAEKGLGGWFGEEQANAEMLGLFYKEMERIEKLKADALEARRAPAPEALKNRQAFSFQIAMLEQCKSNYQAALEASRSGTAVTDRTVLGNTVFAAMHADDGNLSEQEFAAYLSLMSGDRRAPYRSDRIVYVDASPRVAHQRILHVRRRDGEDAIPLAYLEKLEAA